MRITFTTLLLLALLGPSAAESNGVEDKGELSRSQLFALDPFEPPIGNSMVLGNAIPTLVKTFGEPQSVKTSDYPDRTSNRILVRTTLEYPDLVFNVNEDENREHSWIQRTEITGAQYRLKFGVGVDLPRRDIIAAFDDVEYLGNKRQLHIHVNVFETRTDTVFRPGEEVTGEAHIEITFEFNESDLVTRIVLESIEL